MKLIAIDPSSKAPAYSTWINSGLESYGQMPLHPLHSWEKFIHTCDVLIIERQYAKKVSKNNGPDQYDIHMLISLVKSVGMMEAFAYTGELKVKWVAATSWQSKLLNAHWGAKRPELKRLSKMRASDTSGEAIRSDDIADAINIGEFYWKYIFKEDR